MKITSLRIERFGVWENLNLPKLSRGLNVFFGPNEAGKTTLMQFIRTCLYGGGDEDRARYIQMALDGRRRRERRGGRVDASDPRRARFASSLAASRAIVVARGLAALRRFRPILASIVLNGVTFVATSVIRLRWNATQVLSRRTVFLTGAVVFIPCLVVR